MFSADGNKLFFYSERPRDGSDQPCEDSDIWYVERTEDGWSDPINPGPPLNSQLGEYPGKLESNGTFHLTVKIDDNYDLFRSTFRDGMFSEPTTLSPPVNTPGSFESDPQLVLDGRALLFTSFRRTGEAINEGGARFPGISRTGRCCSL